MKIKIEFQEPVFREKILHNLRNVKKLIPKLRQYPHEVLDDKFLIKNETFEVIAEFDFEIKNERIILFNNFKGSDLEDEVKKMLMFNLAEDIGERCFVIDEERRIKLFENFGEWFLLEKGKMYKLGRDKERLSEVELYHVPKWAKENREQAVGKLT